MSSVGMVPLPSQFRCCVMRESYSRSQLHPDNSGPSVPVRSRCVSPPNPHGQAKQQKRHAPGHAGTVRDLADLPVFTVMAAQIARSIRLLPQNIPKAPSP